MPLLQLLLSVCACVVACFLYDYLTTSETCGWSCPTPRTWVHSDEAPETSFNGLRAQGAPQYVLSNAERSVQPCMVNSSTENIASFESSRLKYMDGVEVVCSGHMV